MGFTEPQTVESILLNEWWLERWTNHNNRLLGKPYEHGVHSKIEKVKVSNEASEDKRGSWNEKSEAYPRRAVPREMVTIVKLEERKEMEEVFW